MRKSEIICHTWIYHKWFRLMPLMVFVWQMADVFNFSRARVGMGAMMNFSAKPIGHQEIFRTFVFTYSKNNRKDGSK